MSTNKHLINFNQLYNDLLNELNSNFKLQLKINNDLDTLDNLLDFMRYNMPYMNNISIRNSDFLCSADDIFLVNNVLFKDFWKIADDNSKISVWKYLHTMYIKAYSSKLMNELLETHFADSPLYNGIKLSIDYYSDILNDIVNFLSGKYNEPVNNTLPKPSSNESKPSSDKSESAQMPEFLKKSKIGQFAEEIAKDINISEFNDINNISDLMTNIISGKGAFGDIMKNVNEKINNKFTSGELKPEDLAKDAQNLMANLNTGDSNMFDMIQSMMGAMAPQSKTSKKKNKNRKKKR